MNLRPRKNEWQAVLAILESDNEFETLEDMAKEIVQVLADEFAKRDWYAFGIHVGDIPVGYGPLTSETEVRKFAEKIGWSGRGVKLYSTANALERLID